MSDRVLYDLAGADEDRRFSPYCWRTRMALAHKGLPVTAVPWRFTEKAEIAFSGSTKVPVLVDGETTVSDSWAIAVYLEEHYPDRPSLFGGGAALAVTHFINAWVDRALVRGIAPLIVADIFDCLHDKDRAYFRATREKFFGASLESITATRDAKIAEFRQTLDPLRATLRDQAFLGGETPRYADYIVFGAFQWARCTSKYQLLEPQDPIAAWNETLLDAFDGLARNARA
jgi:glutathione S-transferase